MLQVEYSDYFISEEHFNVELTSARIVTQYEIELITTDYGITFYNGDQFPHKKNNIIIAVPGDIRQTKNKFECYSVKFSLEQNDSLIPYLKALAGVTNIIRTSKIENVYNEIYNAFSKNFIDRELYLDAKVRELIALIYRAKNTADASGKYSHHYDAIYRCTKFISENFDKDLTLLELAKTANLSPTFFHTVFKSIIGKTPYEYFTACRIQNAVMLLENSTFSIEEISFKCGFSSRQYFDTVFKKQTGETPFQYRKAILI